MPDLRYDVRFYNVGNGFIRSANQTLDIRKTAESSPLRAYYLYYILNCNLALTVSQPAKTCAVAFVGKICKLITPALSLNFKAQLLKLL